MCKVLLVLAALVVAWWLCYQLHQVFALFIELFDGDNEDD